MKIFTYDEEFKYAVGQVFTLDIDDIFENIDEYVEILENMKEDGGYKFVIVAITDVLKNGSYFIFTKSAKEIIESGYELTNIKEGEYVKGQVSRKKQIVPALINGIERV